MKSRTRTTLLAAAGLASLVGAATASHSFAPPALPNGQVLKDKAFAGAPVGQPEVVGKFYGPVPVGVAVSPTSRVFVSFPRTMDLGPQTLGEWKNGRVAPFPNQAMNNRNARRDAKHLVSVQGITVDRKNRLWVLDTGKIMSDPITPGSGATKLVGIDLANNRVVKTITFPASVAGKNAYFNDVRVSPFLGRDGTAFITDSSEQGPNGIVVVDLATGKSRRRLNDHPSVKAEPGFVATVEGMPLLVRKPGQKPTNDTTGSDGLALSGDGSQLYYCPNAGHQLYSVSTKALADARQSDDAVAATVKELGDKGFASDGIEADSGGRLFLTDYEHDAIRMRKPDGTYSYVARNPAMVWPDSIAVVPGGYLYFTSNQLNRRTQFHNGTDLRRKPYIIYRVRVPGSQPQASGWRGK